MQIESSFETCHVRCLAKGCAWTPPHINNKGKATHEARIHIEHTSHDVEVGIKWTLYRHELMPGESERPVQVKP